MKWGQTMNEATPIALATPAGAYVVLQYAILSYLTDDVQNRLDHGWQLYGTPFTCTDDNNDTLYHQAMIKPVETVSS